MTIKNQPLKAVMGGLIGRTVLAYLLLAGVVRAQGNDPRVGVKVVTKYMKPLMVDNPTGGDRTVFRTYTVGRTNGDSLWLLSGKVERWVGSSEVIAYDRAIEFYTDEIHQNPRNQSAFNCRGAIHLDKHMYDPAIADFTEAIRLDREDAWAYTNRGVARRDKKDFSGSISDSEAAIRLEPKNPNFHLNAASCWNLKGEYEKAIASYNEAIRLDPKFAAAHIGRAIAWHHAKDYGKSIADSSEAIKLDPKNPMARNALSWTLATCPVDALRDGSRAVKEANKACELDAWRTADYLGTLAAAYAESGQFDRATRREQEAIKLTPSGSDQIKGRQERLALYRASKPYRAR
jgi:tetratricopeptide (TPR) repeat protein